MFMKLSSPTLVFLRKVLIKSSVWVSFVCQLETLVQSDPAHFVGSGREWLKPDVQPVVKSATLSKIQPTSWCCSQAVSATTHGARVVPLRACQQHHELVPQHTQNTKKMDTHSTHTRHHLPPPLLPSPPLSSLSTRTPFLFSRPSHTHPPTAMHTVLEREGEREEGEEGLESHHWT